MPCHANHQATIVPPVGRPPFLAVGHQGFQVVFNRFQIQLFEFFGVVKLFAQRISLGVVLVEDVQIQRVWPPVGVGFTGLGDAAVHDGTFACCFIVHSVSHRLLSD